MDCPLGGEAAAQAPDPCIAGPAADMADDESGDFELNAESWRGEIAARLQRYRTRRKPRPPRYPSLRLPFDAAESRSSLSREMAALPPPPVATTALAPAFEPEAETREESLFVAAPPRVTETPAPFNNVIEFPRFAAEPTYYRDELAEPLLERPRILEAPEIVPAPPALGGILIDPAPRAQAHSSQADLLPTASLRRRILAGAIDAFIMVGALGGFAAMFLWVNLTPPAWPIAVAAGATIWTLLWASYQFLFLVYTGSTPGLRAVRLRLTRFDGSAPGRKARRWRVLASYLSAVSLGLGYLWCVLDEDGLCWHDRMTRTHVCR